MQYQEAMALEFILSDIIKKEQLPAHGMLLPYFGLLVPVSLLRNSYTSIMKNEYGKLNKLMPVE
ncbi:hypothetical protein [Paenibacillus sp. Y412MC10]|uniref:hypothetical protein n=1 Tax=Geobacillus sp. (strain Y412MC10) TaxID=481743 RepID=UPI0011AB8059|nr:hypothetical protein [Paenibacillus sp. Y412MC10]